MSLHASLSSAPIQSLSLPTVLPSNPARRADTLALKQRLADLLPEEDGLVYWKLLVDFMTGKICREEWEEGGKGVLSKFGPEAVRLHNLLLMSLLYNTTVTRPPPSLPPPTPGAARPRTGWTKRKRGEDGSKLEDRDPKRRLIKDLVLRLGKRERRRLKAIGGGDEGGSPTVNGVKGKVAGRKAEKQGVAAITGHPMTKVRALRRGPPVIPSNLKNKPPLATLLQDYQRSAAAPLCSELKQLPEVDVLRDRMSLIAYHEGLVNGADQNAAALLSIATETHLKTVIQTLFELIRAPSESDPFSAPSGSPESSQINVNGDAMDTDQEGVSDVSSVAIKRQRSISPTPIPSPRSKRRPSVSTITLKDMSGLLEIAPHILVQPFVGAVEKGLSVGLPTLEAQLDNEEREMKQGGDEEDGYADDESDGQRGRRRDRRKLKWKVTSFDAARVTSNAREEEEASKRGENGIEDWKNPGKQDKDSIFAPFNLHLIPTNGYPKGTPNGLPFHHAFSSSNGIFSSSSAQPHGAGHKDSPTRVRGRTASRSPVLTKATLGNGNGADHQDTTTSLRLSLFPELDNPSISISSSSNTNADGVTNGTSNLHHSLDQVRRLSAPMSPSGHTTTTDGGTESDENGPSSHSLGHHQGSHLRTGVSPRSVFQQHRQNSLREGMLGGASSAGANGPGLDRKDHPLLDGSGKGKPVRPGLGTARTSVWSILGNVLE